MPVDRFTHERELLQTGVNRIAGVDEAGRGPLAGPVIAAAVVLPAIWVTEGLPHELQGLNDSKALSPAQRERFYAFLTECPDIDFALARVNADVIDRINILQATHRAMDQATCGLQDPPEHLLVDGRPVGILRWRQTALVKGDSRSYSIAAASVLAKVTRDRLMMDFDREWPDYGFAEHKGYGTARHLEALAKHGPCPIHRRSFAPIRPVERELF